MEIKTFRAKTMQQALDLVRCELGSEATVLHTRELNSGLIGRLLRGRQYEIAASPASSTVQAAPRPESVHAAASLEQPTPLPPVGGLPPLETDYRARYRDHFHNRLDDESGDLLSLADRLQQQPHGAPQQRLPESLFDIYTELIQCDVEQDVAREFVDRLGSLPGIDRNDPQTLRGQLTRMIESELAVAGPLDASGPGRKLVALVGPTGVGKTTTIAKLAANYRLRENKRVGLITVDTYRIAAVEQLRTYADIIDLPMEVVSTPREMREATARMHDFDLVLMDTAGRSPRDEIKIQELKSMLAEAEPDEVHLVLSAVGSTRSLISSAEQFSTVGTTALVVTKLDEAVAMGNLLSLLRHCKLPVSYLTDGQNVPDDIQIAQRPELAQMILGMSN